jgi:hypothetical protein
MSKTRVMTWGLLLIVSVVLASCNLQSASQPTPDVNAIFTAAAQTVEAKISQTAAANPTATMTATEAASPTSELPPLPTLPPLTAGTVSPNEPTPAVAFTIAPLPGLSTPTVPLALAPDKEQFVDQFPPDGAEVVKGAMYDIKFTIRNVGTTTWNTKYTIRFFAGTNLVEKNSYPFRGTTKPGDTTTVFLDGVTPQGGSVHSWWKLVNDQGLNFGDVDLTIKVISASQTPTKTKAP